MAVLGQVSDTDVRLLRIFRAIVESGGFSAAELALGLSAPALSRHMKDLEIRLGVVLCRRGRAGFALTEDGERVYRASESLFAAFDQFISEVEDDREVLRGTLSIALFDQIVSNPAARIDRAFQRFGELAPDVRLEIHVQPLNQIEQGVLEGRYQVGISPEHRRSARLDYLYLFSEAMSLYHGDEHDFARNAPETPEVVRQARFAGLGYHSPNMLAAQQLELNRSAVAYDQEAVAHLILSSHYIGFLPDHYAAPWVQDRRMFPVLRSTFNYAPRYSAIWLKGHSVPLLSAWLQALEDAHR